MSMTLKLSHVSWPTADGPHGWAYKSGGMLRGPARLLDATIESIQDDVGGRFEDGKLYDPGHEGRIYVDTAPGDPYRWRLDGAGSLPADFNLSGLYLTSNPAHDIEAWLGGVRQVTALGDVLPETQALKDVVNGNDPRFAHLCGPGAGIEHWTWMGPEKKTIRKVLMVSFEDGTTRVMLVERAWLLGPDGKTIERVAP